MDIINVTHYTAVIVFLSLILVGNIPVGFYKKKFTRFSRPWARCIYIPILVNIILRRFFGIGYGIIPFTILVLFAGQFIGSKIKINNSNTQYDKRGPIPD